MDALLVRVLEGVSLAIPSLLVARQGCECKCEPVLNCPLISSFWLLFAGYVFGVITGLAVSAVLVFRCSRQRSASTARPISLGTTTSALSEPVRSAQRESEEGDLVQLQLTELRRRRGH
eukprot:6465190-Amphidinium_carterae.2